MRFSPTRLAAIKVGTLTLCGFLFTAAYAQGQIRKVESSDATARADHKKAKGKTTQAVLSPDDGLSVIAAALDAPVKPYRERDCSHFVHAIYLRAQFPYPYASSDELYAGADGFTRVTRPQPGDLIVWPGHVGIVVYPARRLFFSRLRRGPGVDDYDAQYWKERGQARFYRYVKTGAANVAATRLVTSQRDK